MYRDIPIDQVIVPPGQRTLHDVTGLMASIQELGLLNPIRMTTEYQLIAGYHRLEACKRLNWTEIPAIIINLDELRTEMAKIDENLIRHNLTELERAEQIYRGKQIYEALYPQSMGIGGPGRGHCKKRRKDFGAFTVDTAVKTRYSARTIQQEVQIATQLSNRVKDLIRPLAIADKKVELLQLARLPQETQEAVAVLLASEGATSVRAAQRALNAEPAAPAPMSTIRSSVPQPAGGRVGLANRGTLLESVVAHIAQAATIANGKIRGEPAANVLAQRFAALPMPELVLLSAYVRGQGQEAAKDWMAAVCVDAEGYARIAERGSPPRDHQNHTGMIGDQHPTHQDNVASSVMTPVEKGLPLFERVRGEAANVALEPAEVDGAPVC